MHLNTRLQTQIILLGSIVLLLFLFSAAYNIYQIAMEETRDNYQAQQREMAATASAGISNYLQHLESDLNLLVSFPCVQNFTRPLLQSNVYLFYKNAQHQAVKSIIVVDHKADLVYATSESLPPQIELVLKNQLREELLSTTPVWYSPILETIAAQNRKELSFLIFTPIFKRDVPDDSASVKKITGFLGYWVGFNWFVENYVAPISVGRSGVGWIMDSRGKLLFHPTHPEMVLRSTTHLSASCRPCHGSFEIQNHILTAAAGNAVYHVAPEPVKLMAHVPIHFQNERWILVVSTTLPEITAILQEKFRVFFILVIFVALVIIGSSILLHYLNTRRIRAEEAQRFVEKKEQMQSQIDQATKLASIGELIDSVAHEINTPLSIISVHTDSLKIELAGIGKDFEEIQIIKDQTRRIGNYIRSLLNYSRRMPFNPEPVDLGRLIDECLYLLGHRFRAQQIRIEKNYAANLPKMQLDYRQMEQVFINLLNNAVDAMPNSGTIRIRISERSTPGIIGVLIEISDTGAGIHPANLPEIFKAFFSTKPASKGTGLGLSISKAIIQRHQGQISVVSELNQGTTFQIFLPQPNLNETE